MPQNGFHGLFGLWTARKLAPFAPSGELPPFAIGVVIGSMVPDLDMYPTGIAFLFGHSELTYVIHRTATHSLLLALVILAIGLVIRRWRWICVGLSIGACTHIALDTFFWFTQIDMFWPLSRLDTGLPIVNLWSQEKLSGLWVNFREAFEYAAFALLLRSLRQMGTASGTSAQSSRKWEVGLWVGFLTALITAFLFRERPALQHYIVSAPYLLLFFPYCLSRVWQLRREIAKWALAEEPR
jgi:membrane-bound metal-dependent hydrolase YbcI (DUF457 family)